MPRVTPRSDVRLALEPTGPETVDAMDLKNAEDLAQLECLPLLGQTGYLVKGCSNVLSAPPKGGKTRLIYHSMADWLGAGETVLYFTEESKFTWQRRLKDIDIIDTRGLQLVFGMGAETEELLEILKAGTQTVVVVDTLRHLGCLGGDENNNGSVARAMEPWITTCRSLGKTFVGLHHDRKTGGKHGQGVSGAHSLVGAVDVVLQVSRGGKDNRRTVAAIGRLCSPPKLTYQLLPDGSMEAVVCRMIGLLPSEPPGWEVTELVRVAGVGKSKALASLADAVEAGSVVREGAGLRNAPFTYWRP